MTIEDQHRQLLQLQEAKAEELGRATGGNMSGFGLAELAGELRNIELALEALKACELSYRKAA